MIAVATAGATAGLPTRRIEGWRWSDLSAALPQGEPPTASSAPIPEASPSPIDWRATSEFVFLDGWLSLVRPKSAPPKDAHISQKPRDSVRDVAWTSPLSRLAIEGANDRAWLTVLTSASAGQSILLRHIGRATAFSRHEPIFVGVGAGERMTLVETFEGEAAGFTNSLTSCTVAPGGELKRIVLQTASSAGVIVSTAEVEVQEGGAFRQFVLAEGAKLARVETHVRAEAGAQVELNGVYLAGATRRADLTSQVVLGQEGAIVRQLTRGVARKSGRGVFQGKFKVDRLAQRTDAEMQHNALLLEDGAEIFSKPELEIYADDVKCSHGNSVGQLDEAAIFYLRSRGICEAEARAMITRAFLLGALPNWLEDPGRSEVEKRIDAWLGAAR